MPCGIALNLVSVFYNSVCFEIEWLGGTLLMNFVAKQNLLYWSPEGDQFVNEL